MVPSFVLLSAAVRKRENWRAFSNGLRQPVSVENELRKG
jgi:hypothetical protein